MKKLNLRTEVLDDPETAEESSFELVLRHGSFWERVRGSLNLSHFL